MYILINNRRLQINAGSNFLFFLNSRKNTWPLTLHVFLLRLFHVLCCFLSVNITLKIAMAPVQQKNKKYNFKLSVIKYAEENLGEAAARRFSVDPKRVRDCLQKTTIAQRDARGFTEKLAKFVTFSSRIFVRKELNAWTVKWLKQINTLAIIWYFTVR